MSNITITHKKKKIISVSVNDGDSFVLKDIIEKYASDIYKDMYGSYNKSDDVATYWIEYNGYVFPNEKKFVCKCDMDFVLKCAIADRDAVNTSLEYNGFSDIPLNFTSDDANGSTIEFDNSFNDIEVNLEYSSDNATWTIWDGSSISLNYGEKIYIRGKNRRINSIDGQGVFIISGATKAAGNIMSLICNKNNQFPDIVPEYCFYSLFSGCEITTAPELPCLQLSAGCYSSLFYECLLLATAPELPATTLSGAAGCYSYMFFGCISLVSAPKLPATELSEDCYSYIFSGCTSLTVAPELPATKLAPYCYFSAFEGCTSLTVAPELPAAYTKDNSITGDIAITLPSYCYAYMFYNTAITKMPELKSQLIGEGSYTYMFGNCTSLTTTSKLELYAVKSIGCRGMFYGCTSLTTSPTLVFCNMFYDPDPVSLTEHLAYMFKSCSSLSEIRIERNNIYLSISGAATSQPIGYTISKEWVDNISASGTFYKDTSYNIPTSTSGIPSGWTVIDF